MIALTEVNGIDRIGRAFRLPLLQRLGDVRIFHEAEAHRHMPEARRQRLDMKPAAGPYARPRGKLHRERNGLLVERAHLAHVISDQRRDNAAKPGKKDRSAWNALNFV